MDAQEVRTIFKAEQVQQMLHGLGLAVLKRHPQTSDLALVGIRTGGAHLALRLRAQLAVISGRAPDTGIMDITLYRDDWTRLHSRPKVGKTEIDFPIDNRVVVLVDDVHLHRPHHPRGHGRAHRLWPAPAHRAFGAHRPWPARAAHPARLRGGQRFSPAGTGDRRGAGGVGRCADAVVSRPA